MSRILWCWSWKTDKERGNQLKSRYTGIHTYAWGTGILDERRCNSGDSFFICCISVLLLLTVSSRHPFFHSHIFYPYHFMMRLLRWKREKREDWSIMFSLPSHLQSGLMSLFAALMCEPWILLLLLLLCVMCLGSVWEHLVRIIRFFFLPTSVSTCLHVYLRASEMKHKRWYR